MIPKTRFTAELTSRLKKRGTNLWTYLLKMAWIAVFRDIYDAMLGTDPPMYVRIGVAIAFTIVTVLFTIYSVDDDLMIHELMEDD